MHYAVLVVTKEVPTEDAIRDLLAPYSEDPEICPPECLEFIDRTQELEDAYNNPTFDAYYRSDGSLTGDPRDLAEEITEQEYTAIQIQGDYFTWTENGKYYKNAVSHEVKEVVPGSVLYGSLEATAEQLGYVYNDSEEAYGYFINLDAKWDWYAIGGRFSHYLYVSKEVYENDPAYQDNIQGIPSMFGKQECYRVNSARIKDIINWFDPKVYLYSLQTFIKWENYVRQGKELAGEEFPLSLTMYKPEYVYRRYKDAETYAKCMSAIGSYVILKEGEWFDPGSLGWISAKPEDELEFDLNFMETLLEGIDDSYWITMVDCHI